MVTKIIKKSYKTYHSLLKELTKENLDVKEIKIVIVGSSAVVILKN
jgi:hypothetical protein